MEIIYIVTTLLAKINHRNHKIVMKKYQVDSDVDKKQQNTHRDFSNIEAELKIIRQYRQDASERLLKIGGALTVPYSCLALRII